jgi:uncharacterized protein (DUF4213/DUF364 family)
MRRLRPWELYDDLIDNVPDSARLEALVVTQHWILAKLDMPGGLGLAQMVPRPQSAIPPYISGTPARVLATKVKSWRFDEAAVGLAVINAALNAQRLKNIEVEAPHFGNIFLSLAERTLGKSVAMVGHFPRLKAIQNIAHSLVILDKDPNFSDYPDAADEYILPETEFVFLSPISILKKNMPRVLQLCRNAEVHIIGPSVPLFPELLTWGFATISGLLLTDYQPMVAELKSTLDGAFNIENSKGRWVSYFGRGFSL